MMLLDQLQETAPSAFAGMPSSDRSDKYGMIDTLDVYNKMVENGYVLHKANQVKTKKPEWQGFQKHRLVFNSPYKTSEYNLQVMVTNSYNGSSSLRFDIGVLVFICNNGLVRFTSDQTTLIRHSLSNSRHWKDLFEMFLPQFESTQRSIQLMKNTPMNQEKKEEFVQLALGLRWDKIPKSMTLAYPFLLFSAKRNGFAGDNLWETFNNVQENLVQGVVKRIKPIRSINKDMDLNQKLWQLAESYTFV